MYRYLLDTNIIISGLFWSGNESELLKLALENKFNAVICEFVIQETERIIDEKFADMENKIQPILSMLLNSVERYPLISSKKINKFNNKHENIISDKQDLIILATALDAQVDAIITGDKHFDSPKIKQLITIIDAKKAFEKINS